uniref:peptidylprolyl isomerase n=1 Tax=Amphora coffeiformis TaxID=265554 RepID=A0A7S3LHP4_9STRA|eukprot:scaffold5158_cov153-Amphora_coffeaeformis.AAC.1
MRFQTMIRLVTLGFFFLSSSHAFMVPSTATTKGTATTTALSVSSSNDDQQNGRRHFLGLVASSVVVAAASAPPAAFAGIDPAALKALPVEGDVSGGATRLRQVQAINQPESDNVDRPWEDLPSGVLYREYRQGKGNAVVTKGSKVAVEMTIRCRSFATANEPGGLKYFNTKEDTTFNELAWTIGDGTLPPGLEEGMEGMKKGGLRRIELPSTQVFAARKAAQLPLATTKDGQRRFEQLFKTDATLLFEVLVTRIK